MRGMQTGWRITELPSGSLRAWAWDPVQKRYQCRSFPAGYREAARRWAEDKHAKYRMGLDRASGGLVPTGKAVEGFLVELRRRRRVEQHLREAGRVLAAFAALVPDLAAPEAERQALAWWDDLPNRRERRADHDAVLAAAVRRGKSPPAAEVIKPLSAETCNRYLVFVKALVKHAQEQSDGVLRTSPVARIHKLGLDRRLKDQFTVDEIRKLVGMREDPYRRMFALMALAGLRIGEACAIRWGDIDWSGDVLAVRLREGVRIKRRKERLVPMMPALRQVLEPDKGDAEAVVGGYAVLNGHRDFSRFLGRAGVSVDGRGPHACRHSYAGVMTATGVPSLLLASYMGHDSMATTAGYAAMATRYVTAVGGWKRGDFEVG